MKIKQFVTKIQEMLNTTDRFEANAGCRVTEQDATHAVAEMMVRKEHLNAGGMCQSKETKVATKDSWNIEPMPDRHTTIPMDETIPSAVMRIVKQGHIPEAMEDHWFMYCDDTTIRYYRSWTGFCIYIAKYEDDGTNCRITDLTVNRDPEQYSNTDDEEDVELFIALLASHVC